MSIELDAAELAGRRILCAVSGGADSVCLLHLLHSGGYDVCAAHYEHGIRGAEAMRDARFVEELCRKYGIECLIGHGDVPAYAAEHSLGIEEAARQLRYEFLRSAADSLGCELIATAHNADDNAETLLFNLTRGSGTAGLRGIPERRGNIVRPLLHTTRSEIEQYLLDNKLPHVEDSTNEQDAYTRNKIRHCVMPVLREINPRFSEAVLRTGKLAAQDDDCLNSLAREFTDKYSDNGSLPLEGLCSLHPAVSSRVLRLLLGGGLSMEHIDSILAFAGGTELAYLSIPGHTLRREKGRLYLDDNGSVTMPERVLEIGKPLFIPEAGLTLTAESVIYCGEVNDLFKTYFLKCENIDPILRCSGRMAGDRLRPIGRGCTKTLKALFAEADYTLRQRDTTPVIRDSGGVLAVYGLGADERTRPEYGDKALRLCFIKTENNTGEK